MVPYVALFSDNTTAVPVTGSTLRVEVELPSDGVFAPRLIRCDSIVVRVIPAANGHSQIALKVNNMRFVDDPVRLWQTESNHIPERVN